MTLGASDADAALLYVHDDLNLAKIDISAGTVALIGNTGVALTDIAFDPSGTLYGLTFDSLWLIDPDTAAATFIGDHAIPSGNALVFDHNGTLYAGGSGTTNLYTLDPATAASSLVGDTGFFSAGDFAFYGGKFYGTSYLSDLLVDIDPATGAGTAIGPLGFVDVFGLAVGDDGILYGAAGTNIFSIDTSTGAGTLVFDYGESELGDAWGAATPFQPIPEPTAFFLFTSGLALFARVVKGRKQV